MHLTHLIHLHPRGGRLAYIIYLYVNVRVSYGLRGGEVREVLVIIFNFTLVDD